MVVELPATLDAVQETSFIHQHDDDDDDDDYDILLHQHDDDDHDNDYDILIHQQDADHRGLERTLDSME